jgi:G3E family GTPase
MLIYRKNEMSSIPFQLVTGFLGSGKTTFLKNYLEKFSGPGRIGIIQNEFSALNVDAAELRQANDGYKILEVNNGSAFCVCLLGSFAESLSEFIDQVHPDELVMEASGMSDPMSVGQILQSPGLKAKVYLDQVWCLVDAVNFGRMTRLNTRLNHQVRMADSIIINKTDLVNEAEDTITQQVRKLNPFASIRTASFAKIDFERVQPVMKFYPATDNAEDFRPNLQSQVIKSNRTISRIKMEDFMQLVAPDCIRGKGYINTDSGEKVLMQLSFDQVSLRRAEAFSGPTEFVLIGNFPEKTSFQKIFDSFCTP